MIQAYRKADSQTSRFILQNGYNLLPSSCILSAELGGSWSLELHQPRLGDGRELLIEAGGVISAPSFNGQQYFRIMKTELNDSEMIAYAYPIFYDAMNWVFIRELTLENASGADVASALNSIVTGNSTIPFPFRVNCSITTKKSISIKFTNLLAAVQGESSDGDSIMNIYGGFAIFNNWDADIIDKSGKDTGIIFRYGKNLKGIRRTISDESRITRVFPISNDDFTLTKAPYYEDLAPTESEPSIVARAVKFENLNLGQRPPENRDDALRYQVAVLQWREALYGNDITAADIEYEFDLAILNDTVEYKKIGYSDKPNLGDNIKVIDEKSNIEITAQITALTYDCIANEVTSIKSSPINQKQQYFDLNSARTITPSIEVFSSKSEVKSLPILWEGAARMVANSPITLAKSINEQEHGLKLIWQMAADGSSAPYGDTSIQDIPKNISTNAFVFRTGTVDFGVNCAKKITVENGNQLLGSEYNTYKGTSGGITYANDRLVLVSVLGY